MGKRWWYWTGACGLVLSSIAGSFGSLCVYLVDTLYSSFSVLVVVFLSIFFFLA